MGNIFTRKALSDIMANEGLTPEQRTEQVMSLYGRALDDGYISKSAAQTAQETALNNAKAEWEKGLEKPNVKESDEYKALQGQFDAYKTMQNARTSDDYKEVKPKFFETVYGMIKREDGAKPVKDQLAEIRGNYEEYFTVPPAPKPTFGAPTQGSMPTGDEGAAAQFMKAWGISPKK
jgi:hypothetical protein